MAHIGNHPEGSLDRVRAHVVPEVHVRFRLVGKAVPLFVTNDANLMTLPVGLSLLQGEHTSDWNLIMPGAVIAVAPLILIFFAAQRTFINGMMQSGLKG